MVSSMTGSIAHERVSTTRTAIQHNAAFRTRLLATDTAVVVVSVFASQWVWLGADPGHVAVYGRLGDVVINYLAISAAVVALWLTMLVICGTRSSRVVGSGPGEYRAVTKATVLTFSVVAIVSYLLQIDVSRGYILLAFPVGLLALVVARFAWRQWLTARRERGEMCERVLVVGHESATLRIAADLARNPAAGYRVVGSCTTEGGEGFLAGTDVPLFGSIDRVEQAIDLTGADTVVVSSGERLPAERIREISWYLEAGRQHLVVAQSLTDIGGPRMHIRPVAGLPLVHVETPRYSTSERVVKRTFDVLGSAALIAALSPVLLVLAVLVRASGPGPVLFFQERVGIRGEHFKMIKFRSMRDGADAQLQALLAAQGTSDTPLFKVDDDPRITAIGKVLRKYSLDELPQLFNVFGGSMSLVGPRPQRDGEVALYDDAARRRLIAKPGMSGLWQVSGRSALSWEETIRLDLCYVENWSLAGDLSILLRTAKAVVAPGKTAH